MHTIDIPLESMICLFNPALRKLSRELELLFEVLDGLSKEPSHLKFVLLLLYLYYEDRNCYSPYLDILPQSFTLPECWPEEELCLLDRSVSSICISFFKESQNEHNYPYRCYGIDKQRIQYENDCTSHIYKERVLPLLQVL